MTALRYKNYQGSVEFEDGCLVIQILHIDDTIMTECVSAADAQRVFEGLVDDYLETCAKVGKDPCKAFRGSFNVRVAPALHRQVAMAAADCNESMNSWVSSALEQGVEQHRLKKHYLDPRAIIRAFEDRQARINYMNVDAPSPRPTRPLDLGLLFAGRDPAQGRSH
jgi:predicted HicB family RNase H-like nuclease